MPISLATKRNPVSFLGDLKREHTQTISQTPDGEFPKSFFSFRYLKMPIVGLSSFRNDSDSEEEDTRKSNEYFAGGIGSQGGGRLVFLY